MKLHLLLTLAAFSAFTAEPTPRELEARGEAHFFAGEFTEAIADFDAVIKLVPEQAPHHWQRGIALYYARRYKEGREQFEAHKRVNPHDVENAAWHFICAAKEQGLEKARANLIAIDTDKDTRVPMKQVFELFKGTAKPEDVLNAAKAGHPEPEELKNNLCYAHLYLGLYFEAIGDEKVAREHIEKSATTFAMDHYMGKVAQIHWRTMNKK